MEEGSERGGREGVGVEGGEEGGREGETEWGGREREGGSGERGREGGRGREREGEREIRRVGGLGVSVLFGNCVCSYIIIYPHYCSLSVT